MLHCLHLAILLLQFSAPVLPYSTHTILQIQIQPQILSPVFCSTRYFRNVFNAFMIIVSVNKFSASFSSADFAITSDPLLCFAFSASLFFCSNASAANCNAVDASPSKLDCRRIPKIALTASKTRPALVDITALIFRSAIVNCTLLSCSLQSPSFSMISQLSPGPFCISIDHGNSDTPSLFCRSISTNL